MWPDDFCQIICDMICEKNCSQTFGWKMMKDYIHSKGILVTEEKSLSHFKK